MVTTTVTNKETIDVTSETKSLLITYDFKFIAIAL